MRPTYERTLAGSSTAHAEMIRMPARRPARGPKSPSNQAFRSKAARPGRPLGIKFWQHRPVEGELADIACGRFGRRRAAGRGWSCSRRSGFRPASPPAGRSGPDTSAGGLPGRSSRPTIGTSARLPGANTAAKRASAISASTCPRARRARPRSSPRHCGRGSVSASSRRRSAATSGSDCSRRCTSTPRCSARARSAIASPLRTAGLLVGGIGRTQAAIARGRSGAAARAAAMTAARRRGFARRRGWPVG